jgi:hypothetical protein
MATSTSEKLCSGTNGSLYEFLPASMEWDYVSELWPPAGLLFIRHMSMERRWNDIYTKKPKNSETNLSKSTRSTTNPTQTKQGANPGFCGERPATNRLSHGTDESRPTSHPPPYLIRLSYQMIPATYVPLPQHMLGHMYSPSSVFN